MASYGVRAAKLGGDTFGRVQSNFKNAGFGDQFGKDLNSARDVGKDFLATRPGTNQSANNQAQPQQQNNQQQQNQQQQNQSPPPSTTAKSDTPTDKGEKKSGEKLAGADVPMPKEDTSGKSFLETAIANAPKDAESADGLAALTAAIVGMQGGGAKDAKPTSGDGNPQAIVNDILQLANTGGPGGSNRGTNSPTGGAGGAQYGTAFMPSDRLLNSLNAPARAVKPKPPTAAQQFLDEGHARGVAAAGAEEPPSTEGGRVRVFDGGYGGNSGEGGGGSVNLRSGGSVVPASGHRGAGD